ncbi:MAG: DUF3352 domain-containing protein, partial [Chloroflexota bacterium]|nr:DUF3352 domain-containing protein [Chloroflexota bacterium]
YGAPPPGQYAAGPPPGQYGAPPPGQYGAPPPTAPYPVAAPPPGQAPRKGHLLRNVLIALALLAVVGVGGVAYLATQTLSPVAATKLLPADVLAFVSFDPHPAGGQKAALDKMQAAFQGQPGWQAALDKIKSQTASVSDTLTATVKGCLDAVPASGTPVPYEEATAFLGHNVTLAMLLLSKAETTQMLTLKGDSAGDDVGKLLLPKVVMIADLDLATLAKQGLPGGLKKVPGGNGKVTDIPVVEKYKDVEIRKISTAQCATDAKDQPLYVALLGSTAAMTFDQNTLHGVIDRFKDSKANGALADSAAYTSLEADLPAAKDRLGLTYINMTSVYNIIQQVSDKVQADLTDALGSTGTPAPPTTKMVKVSGAAVMSLSAHDDGMQVDTVSDTQLDGQAVGTGAAPAADALNDVPAGSWAFYSGADLKTQITQALDLYRKQGMQQQIDDGLAQITKQTGVDLEKDVLPLLGGDYLVSVGGHSGTDTPILTGALELRLKAGDGAKMSSVLDKLHQSMTEQGGAAPQTVAVGNASLFSIEGLPALYGVVGDKVYAVGSSDPDPEGAKTYADSVLSGAGKGMGTDPTIRARLAHVPANSTATLYVDFSKIRQEGVEPMMQGSSKDSYDSEFAPFVRPFQYLLAGGNTTIRNSMNHGHSVLFLAISK